MNNISNAVAVNTTFEPYLCGGTFFTLLLHLGIKYNKSTGKKYSDREVFKGLTEAVTGNALKTQAGTLKVHASYYRGCSDSSYNTPLRDPATAGQYDYEVLHDFDVPCGRMSKFVKDYIDPAKKELLIRSVVELIKMDSSIPLSEHFHLGSEGVYSTKYQLEIEHSFDLASFLVGVTHFVLLKRMSTNTLGTATLEFWGIKGDPAANSHTEPFKFGASIDHPVYVSFPTDEDLSEKAKAAPVIPLNYTPIDIYLKNLSEELMEVHTVIQMGDTAKFKSIYVDTDLSPMSYNEDNDDLTQPTISNVTVKKLQAYGRRIKIIGTGGVGKTMLMRNLFFQQAEAFSVTGVLPIFVEPRSFDCSFPTLIDYMVHYMRHYSEDMTASFIKPLLERGNAVIFFDGVDEMTETVRDVFQDRIDRFKALYPEITIIITSRPPTRDRHFPGFFTFQALKLNKMQAIELIRKVTYWDKDAKARFIVALQNGLFDDHAEYCGIPLFLVILLSTYRVFGGVPTAPHEFFEMAIKTMLGLHDVLKHGYRRRMYCSLPSDEFLNYLAEFGYRAYSHNCMDFNEAEFSNYMNQVIRNRGISTGATSEDFLNDATTGICIMYKEARKYHFLHRSFIEYLAALHLSKRITDRYASLKSFWDKHQGWDDDQTFDMLYAMKKKELDDLLFLPFFEEKLKKYGEGDFGYWQFLIDMYPSIIVTNARPEDILDRGSSELKSLVADHPLDCKSTSFLYNFFKKEKKFSHSEELSEYDWSLEELRHFKGSYISWQYRDDEDGELHNMLTPEWPTDPRWYQITYGCRPRFIFTLSPNEIRLGSNDMSIAIYEKMMDSSFPLRQEYDELCDWVKSSRHTLELESDYEALVDDLC